MPVNHRKPKWIRTRWQQTPEAKRVRATLREKQLHTVCEESSCPNRGDCYNRGTCTFLILGAICTRHCRFCDVTAGRPLPPDSREPAHLADSVKALGVQFVVLTSVDRDDLPDGGAGHFAACVRAIREANPGVGVEVLVPDFAGDEAAIRTVLEAKPDVYAHNVETVRRLSPQVRDRRAGYDQSLATLRRAVELADGALVKSGLMVGLGETDDEVLQTLRDIRDAGAVSVTIGQYLPPSTSHLPVERYVLPEGFADYERAARELGFRHVASGPLVRSSFHAEEIASLLDRKRVERGF